MSEELPKKDKDSLINLSDINDIEELDFSKAHLIKGQTPQDIKEKCLNLCKGYLSGNWRQQTEESIEVNRVSGGLTNQLYYCGIVDKSDNEGVPQEVAIRFYGTKYFDTCDNETNDRMSDVIIGLIVSQNKLGPKIYGLFDQGQIQKFYKHRPFSVEFQKDIKIVTQVMQNLARIHFMDIPIKKQGNWMTKYVYKSYKDAFDKFDIANELDQYNCQTLKDNDFTKEFNWIKGVIESNDIPIVFSHNDYRSSNLMITEPNNELVVCDFEYACYWYRGYDLANLMTEWGRNTLDLKSIDGLPPKDSEFKPLIEMYVKECEIICGKSYSENKFNSVEEILKETKIFLLIIQLFYSVSMLKNDQDSGGLPINRRMSVELAELTFKNYFILKNRLIKQNIFD